MATQVDWQREIDTSIGEVPDRPVDDYLVAGRRAVRRRRLAVGVAGLAAAVVVAGTGWAVAPGIGLRDADAPVATNPDRLPAPMAHHPGDVREAGPDEESVFGDGTLAVSVLGDGELVHQPGWQVDALEVLVDRERRRTWAVSATPTGGGSPQWVMVTWRPGSRAQSYTAPDDRSPSFAEWAEQQWVEQQEGAPFVIRLVGDEVRVPDGTEVLERVDAPPEAAAHGPVEDYVAVRLRRADGTVLFALVHPGGSMTVRADRLPAPTMRAFLDRMQEQGDGGEDRR
jgi:hypothetical protein